MGSVRWIWNVGIPFGGAVAFFVAFLAAWIKGDPAHIWLAYLVGSSWFCDRATSSGG